jgi:hypothetical protein
VTYGSEFASDDGSCTADASDLKDNVWSVVEAAGIELPGSDQ